MTFLALMLVLFAIDLAVQGSYTLSIALAFFSAVLDGLDGYVARFFKEESNFGRQLDSASDIFIYLVYPTIFFLSAFALSFGEKLSLFIFVCCGVFRLIRFNTFGYSYIGKTRGYMGLPVVFSLYSLFFIWFLPFQGKTYQIMVSNLILGFLMIQKFIFPKVSAIFYILLMLSFGLFSFYVYSAMGVK